MLLQFVAAGGAWAQSTFADPAAALRARYAALENAGSQSQFHRPLYIDSSEGANSVTGEVYALVAYPFPEAGAALNDPTQWCDILILHLNVKYCRPSSDGGETILHVNIGKKFDQTMEEAYRLDFAYRAIPAAANYLLVKLNAGEGPLGTTDYRIVLEAAPAEDNRTLIRLSYSYSYGLAARLAMQAYLATIGRNKVGFTVSGKESDGRPRFIGGVRGVTERNTMRYYLAIEAFLGALAVPPQARIETSLRAWFTAVELYPRQLHEMEQGDYLAMKRKEYARQHLTVTGAG